MKKTIQLLFVFVCMSACSFTAMAQSSTGVADEIIAIVKAQWAAEISNPTNVAEILKDVSDDYTEFNGDYSTRLDGKAVNVRLAEAGAKSPTVSVGSEMLNPKVQVYGDVAILSYNFAGLVKSKDGEIKPIKAKSTRVYAKQGGKWKLVHANFGTDPQPKD